MAAEQKQKLEQQLWKSTRVILLSLALFLLIKC
jgi:hypothetical protein